MTPSLNRSSADFFEAKYKRDPDPWEFAENPYELHRYDATLAVLAPRRYRLAYEPGCAVGVLTERLAGICDEVQAIDFSPTAVAHARARCLHLGNVRILCQSILDYLPDRPFDLLVLSEFGYYFSHCEWLQLSSRLIASVSVGGTIVAVHWLGVSPDHRLSGDEVHEILGESPRMQIEQSHRNEDFLLERWNRV